MHRLHRQTMMKAIPPLKEEYAELQDRMRPFRSIIVGFITVTHLWNFTLPNWGDGKLVAIVIHPRPLVMLREA